MPLDEKRFTKLTSLINDSFRVHKNKEPIYVDLSNNLERLGSPQHQVIFGRRGSGKSCLLVHYLRNSGKDSHAVYIQSDEFKKLEYPDVLIRLLVAILEGVPVPYRWLKKLFRRKIPTLVAAESLRGLLKEANEQEISRGSSNSRSGKTSGVLSGDRFSIGRESSSALLEERSSSFREVKLDSLERHLRDHKDALEAGLTSLRGRTVYLLIDDFYLFPRESQPDIIDYIHRLVRDTNVYLKVATIRHRSRLLREASQTVGVELYQDVEEISLDRTLEDLDATKEFLFEMLSSIASQAGVDDLADHFNPDALEALTLVSGGVPRDYLNIFVNAVEAAKASGNVRWLTPTVVYKGAGRLTYKTKLKNLKQDTGADGAGLERLFVDLLKFCLHEKRKTAFLISQDEAQQYPAAHDLIQQLMDFKLVHVVEPDTSAASGRPGRYEAYTLDFSLFMEPRRRGIEHVEFWKIDDQRRRVGIREAPIYPLERALLAFEQTSGNSDAKAVLDSVDSDDSVAGDSGAPTLFD